MFNRKVDVHVVVSGQSFLRVVNARAVAPLYVAVTVVTMWCWAKMGKKQNFQGKCI